MSETTQLTEDDVAKLYAQRRYTEIEDARLAGRLADLLGQVPPPDTDAQLTQADVDRLYADRRYSEIEAARQRGQLNDLLGA